MNNFVPLVVPGFPSPSSSSSAFTSRSKDQSKSSGESETSINPMTPNMHAWKWCGTNPDMQISGSRGLAHTENEMHKENPTQGIPDWVQSFTENLEDLETNVLAHSSGREISHSESDASKVETQKRKHNIHPTSLKTQNCDICFRTKKYECSVLKTQWGIYSTNKKFEQEFAGDGEESTNISGADTKADSYLYGQFIRIWQILWRIIMESSNNYTLSPRDKKLHKELFEGTSAAWPQSGLADGKSQNKRRFWRILLGHASFAGGNWRGRYSDSSDWRIGKSLKHIPEDWMRKKSW